MSKIKNNETKPVLSASLEDYLEVILQLISKNRVARAKDIASNMNVRRASVTGALKALSEKGLINYDPYSYITLTAKGRKCAEAIIHRHNAITAFLIDVLCVDAKVAEENACRMEHVVDDVVLRRFVTYMKNLDKPVAVKSNA